MFSSPMLLDFNSSSKRSKITKACDNCRRRRVKCDGVPDGCGGCKAAKTQCVYTTSNTKRGPPKGYVEVIEDRLGKIENMLAGIVKKKTVLAPQNSNYRNTPSHSDNEDNNEDDDRASVDSSDLVHVKKQPSSPALRPTRSSTPNVSSNARSGSVAFSTLGRHSPLVSRNRSLTTLLPFSQSSPPHMQQDARADMAALTSMFDNMGTTSIRTTVPFPWLTPEQSRQYGRSHLQFSSQSLEPPLPALARSFLPTTSPDTTLQLLNNFFNHFNTHLPIVHRLTFMRQWQQASCQLCQPAASGTGVSQPKANHQKQQQDDVQAHEEHIQQPSTPLSPLLLNALLAIASKIPTDDKQTPEAAHEASTLSQGFFDAAKLLLDDFMDVPRVSTVQALCLMSQFHHQGEWRATRSSSYLAMAIRMAHELGLNRDPEMTYAPEADALRYLWWSMFILDHLFSAWLGLGLLMHGKESDVELPVTFGSSSIALRGFICMVRLVKILGTVLQHSYSTQSLPPQFGGHDSMVSYIEGSLTSWLSNLAPDMRWQNPNFSGARRPSPGSPMNTSRQQSTLSDADGAAGLGKEDVYPSYLYIVYNTTLILLHRPYIVGAAGSPAAAQSNTICTGSGRAITDIAQGLDVEHCSYVMNRFTLYALLQAGVIHAMNAVYDKRGSEAAMGYFKRTIRLLEGFSLHTAYAGGVAEGIKILEQFLVTTSNAAAEEEGNKDVQEALEYCPQEPIDGQVNRGKKRELETGTPIIGPSTSMSPSGEYQQGSSTQSALASGTLAQSQSANSAHPVQSSMMEPTARSSPTSYVFDYDQQQLQQQRLHQQAVDMKEQQRQQQLKIQQQHRMYQQMQTFGTGAVKVEFNAESDLQKLGQQQQQQQQLLRHQLQRQQQRQQQEMELKEQNASTAAAAAAAAAGAATSQPLHPAPAMAAPVIPSHRHAMQLLQQQQQQQHQQHQQQQQQHQHQQYLQQGQHGHVSLPMTMTMAAMTMEAQSKMSTELPMSGPMTSGTTGYDPTQFWVDFSATDQAMPCASGSINSAATETAPSQLGANPLWM
ncbi:hypothetical protein EC968_008520 [Mortierella alpina]|nr:hypothetical protein EC968_008520 [Mortierella alpina]